MKLSKRAKALLAVQLLLLVFICCTPSKKELASITGPWRQHILWNRIRDFAAIPISLGNMAVLLCSCVSNQEKSFSLKSQSTLSVICVIMTVIGIYWTIGVIRMTQFPLMPAHIFTYLLNRPFIFSLWWTVTGIFFFLLSHSKRATD